MKLLFKKILIYFLSIVNILLIMKYVHIINIIDLVFNKQSVDYVRYATCTLRRHSHETAISATAIRNFNQPYDLLETAHIQYSNEFLACLSVRRLLWCVNIINLPDNSLVALGFAFLQELGPKPSQINIVLRSGAGIATVLWVGRHMNRGSILGKDQYFPATVVFFLYIKSFRRFGRTYCSFL